jgi:16S rRNA (cytidine1402-2'-O)-methyltransferase
MALFLVATPLGNLADISKRAIDILQKTPVLAAEDTRSLRRLLSAFQIGVEGRQILTYGDHNEKEMAPRILKILQENVDVAVISEGGSPLVSDPGFRIVREAAAAGVPVVPVPGPCAAIAALTASGLPVHAFLFRGFLPKKPGARMRILESLKDRDRKSVV